LPQYFKENNPVIFLGIEHMGARIKAGNRRVRELLKVMSLDDVSTSDKIEQLKAELGEHHQTSKFNRCKTMGEVLQAHLRLLLDKDFQQSLGE
ncbi:MAG: hypothetical protein AAFN92_11250, partial [Bacteroidota bacterium]